MITVLKHFTVFLSTVLKCQQDWKSRIIYPKSLSLWNNALLFIQTKQQVHYSWMYIVYSIGFVYKCSTTDWLDPWSRFVSLAHIMGLRHVQALSSLCCINVETPAGKTPEVCRIIHLVVSLSNAKSYTTGWLLFISVSKDLSKCLMYCDWLYRITCVYQNKG